MYEAPTMFWGLWQLVSPFIDPETKDKVVFVSSKTAIKEFQEAIDPSVSIPPLHAACHAVLPSLVCSL